MLGHAHEDQEEIIREYEGKHHSIALYALVCVHRCVVFETHAVVVCDEISMWN